jgi:glycosyltransferase involved in cell wall biosynthesis
MHILIAHNDYGKFSGEEQAVQTFAEILTSYGHEIYWLRRSSAEIGNSIFKKVKAFFSGIYSFESKEQIEHIIDKERIDLVQIQNLYPFLSPSILLACKNNKIPVIMRCPNYRLFCPNGLHFVRGQVCERCLFGKEWNCILYNCENDYLKSIGYSIRNATARLTGMIRNNVNTFIVLSEFQKKRFVAGGIGADRVEVLPNIAPAVDIAIKEWCNGDTIAFVGRISSEKGISHFLEAARRLPDYKFAVAGGISPNSEAANSVPSNVSFAGFLSGDKIEDLYRKTRIFVFPSVWFEGFPNVVAKAMAHSKAVIASRIGAMPEIVEDGVTGLLFEPGNVEDLTAKIDYLWNNPQKCVAMGKAGRIKAMDQYSEEKVYRKLVEIYERAIQMNRD